MYFRFSLRHNPTIPVIGFFYRMNRENGLDILMVYAPNNSDALADAIEKLLTDKTLFNHCCEKALEMSQTRYNYGMMSERLIKIYEQLRG